MMQQTKLASAVLRVVVVAACGVSAVASQADAATAIATYEFGNTFAANEAGKPALTVTDPGSLSTFQTDTVLGGTRTVWSFKATDHSPANQAGVTLNTTGLISPESYSVDMVMQFNESAGAWRRIIDVQNRQSDNGFYVDPSNNLDIFPVAGSSAAWSNDVYHHVVLTDNGTVAKGYIDGVSQFTATTAEMNLDFDATSNPSKLMGFFLDNAAGGGQGEYSNGKVSLIRVWDGVLTDGEAAALANNPFLPEPTTLAGLAAAGVLVMRRR